MGKKRKGKEGRKRMNEWKIENENERMKQRNQTNEMNKNAARDHAGMLSPKKDHTTSAQLPSPLKSMPRASVTEKLLKIYPILGPHAGIWSLGRFWRYNCLMAKPAPDIEKIIPIKL